MTPLTRASSIVLALDALDRSEAGAGEDSTDYARKLITGDHKPDLHAGSDLHLHYVCAMRDALLAACAVHAAMLPGHVWEPMSEPWEDRESSRHHVARLADWFLDAILTASACGAIVLAIAGRLDDEGGAP